VPALRFVAPSVHNVTEHQDGFGRLLVLASQAGKGVLGAARAAEMCGPGMGYPSGSKGVSLGTADILNKLIVGPRCWQTRGGLRAAPFSSTEREPYWTIDRFLSAQGTFSTFVAPDYANRPGPFFTCFRLADRGSRHQGARPFSIAAMPAARYRH
jgi:hypothetical protein